MEIRNALQKIENYLTVVANLNKTILSEGTMSRDELLLMKKYLYTSVDRVEDIERLLMLDQKDNKSFTPTEATIMQKFVPANEKEIIEVTDNVHIEEVESVISKFEKEEMEDMIEEVLSVDKNEEMLVVGEITQMIEEEQLQAIEKHDMIPLVESIITEDYSLNKLVENKDEEKELVFEAKSFAESIITEDYTLNKLFENKEEETLQKIEQINEVVSFVESIITEDYSLNKLEETITLVKQPDVQGIRLENPSTNNNTKEVETLVIKFEEQISTTFAEELANKSKMETSLFEQLEQQFKETPSTQLFELFDDGKEEFYETFTNEKPAFEPVSGAFEKPYNTASYEQQDNILVAESEVETVVELLTPSSLNEVFKPQIVDENKNSKTNKTLSESIALNDKFIFVRELFGNHFGEYESNLKQLDALYSFELAENYCKEKLWNKFNWTDKTVAVERLMVLLEKRFN